MNIESLTRVKSLGVGSIPEGRELALKRSTGLTLSGVKDGVGGSKMTPVRVEQLYTDTILGSKDWSVDHMGDLTREVWFGLVGC